MPLAPEKDDELVKISAGFSRAHRAEEGLLRHQYVVSHSDEYQISFGDVTKFLQAYIGRFEAALDDDGFVAFPALDRGANAMTTIKVDIPTLNNMRAGVTTLMNGGFFAGAYMRGQIPPSELGF